MGGIEIGAGGGGLLAGCDEEEPLLVFPVVTGETGTGACVFPLVTGAAGGEAFWPLVTGAGGFVGGGGLGAPVCKNLAI